jgi:glycosyltransferase involved in cell wall biosynthesis
MISPHLPPAMDGCGDATDCLAREYRSRGDDVLVVTDPGSLRERTYACETVGARFDRYAAGRAVTLAREFGADAALMQYTPFLYTPQSLFPLVFARGMRKAGIRLGIYAHECFYPRESPAVRSAIKHRYLTLRDATTLRAADVIFVPNEERRRRVAAHIDHPRIVVSGVAANIEPEEMPARRMPRAPFRLLAFGVVMPRRRLDLIVRALAALVQAGIDAELTIAGRIWDEPYADECVELSRLLDVGERVRFSGALSNAQLTSAFAEHDLFLHAAEEGSVSNAGSLLAALAHGIPIVAARTARDETCFARGVSFAQPNPEGIAHASAEALRVPERLEQLAASARRLYEHAFGWHRIADAVLTGLR